MHNTTTGRFLAATLLAAAFGCTTTVTAQTTNADLPSPLGVVIGVKGGTVWTMPRGRFPSLIIGESQTGSGERESARAGTSGGSRWGLEFLFPFTREIALNLEIGSLHYVAEYGGDTLLPGIRFDAQTLQLAPRLVVNLLSNEPAFAGNGVRNVFVVGGFDLALATVANRVEGAAFPDSLSVVVRRGSFESGEPFRVVVALNGGIGMRIGISQHLEALAEAGYSVALNRVFSSDVVVDNDFTVDILSAQIGIGYRF